MCCNESSEPGIDTSVLIEVNVSVDRIDNVKAKRAVVVGIKGDDGSHFLTSARPPNRLLEFVSFGGQSVSCETRAPSLDERTGGLGTYVTLSVHDGNGKGKCLGKDRVNLSAYVANAGACMPFEVVMKHGIWVRGTVHCSIINEQQSKGLMSLGCSGPKISATVQSPVSTFEPSQVCPHDKHDDLSFQSAVGTDSTSSAQREATRMMYSTPPTLPCPTYSIPNFDPLPPMEAGTIMQDNGMVATNFEVQPNRTPLKRVSLSDEWKNNGDRHSIQSVSTDYLTASDGQSSIFGPNTRKLLTRSYAERTGNAGARGSPHRSGVLEDIDIQGKLSTASNTIETLDRVKVSISPIPLEEAGLQVPTNVTHASEESGTDGNGIHFQTIEKMGISLSPGERNEELEICELKHMRISVPCDEYNSEKDRNSMERDFRRLALRPTSDDFQIWTVPTLDISIPPSSLAGHLAIQKMNRMEVAVHPFDKSNLDVDIGPGLTISVQEVRAVGDQEVRTGDLSHKLTLDLPKVEMDGPEALAVPSDRGTRICNTGGEAASTIINSRNMAHICSKHDHLLVGANQSGDVIDEQSDFISSDQGNGDIDEMIGNQAPSRGVGLARVYDAYWQRAFKNGHLSEIGEVNNQQSDACNSDVISNVADWESEKQQVRYHSQPVAYRNLELVDLDSDSNESAPVGGTELPTYENLLDQLLKAKLQIAELEADRDEGH